MEMESKLWSVSAADTVETLIRSVIYNKEEQYSSIIDAGTGVETTVNESVNLILDLVGETDENKEKFQKLDITYEKRRAN